MKDGSISIGFGGILFIVFLILKLTNVIAWSWWWVTSPLWIPIAIAIVIFIFIFIFQFIIHRKKRNKKSY
jgi:membrane protein YdbS with pleckstrin-like domain